MKFEYDFPVIDHIDDVLPAIEGRDEFVVAEKPGGYTVLNYNVNFEDTFPPVKVTGGSAKMREERSRLNALRRECRGIIFDTATGKIIRRPFHKFFNVNERDETLQRNVNLSEPHYIMDKLDGSMIAPFMVNHRMIWGTKMGDTEVARPVAQHVMLRSRYRDFAEEMISEGLTPIFEWCSNKQRIVIDQPVDQLVLTALRDMRSGAYVDYAVMKAFAHPYEIPVVKIFSFDMPFEEFIDNVREMEDIEGYVVRFNDGHMVKMKCDWYVQIHKAKEAILQDRNIVQIILENELDDIKANVTDEERIRLSEFENEFWKRVHASAAKLYKMIYSIRSEDIDRKKFAVEYAPSWNDIEKSICFRLWDDWKPEDSDKVFVEVINTIKNNLNKTAKYENIRDLWFNGVIYNV